MPPSATAPPNQSAYNAFSGGATQAQPQGAPAAKRQRLDVNATYRAKPQHMQMERQEEIQAIDNFNAQPQQDHDQMLGAFEEVNTSIAGVVGDLGSLARELAWTHD